MVTASAPTTRVAVTVTPPGAAGASAPGAPMGANRAETAASTAIDGGLMTRIVDASYRPGPRREKPIPAELTVRPRSDNARSTGRSGILGTTLSDPRFFPRQRSPVAPRPSLRHHRRRGCRDRRHAARRARPGGHPRLAPHG